MSNSRTRIPSPARSMPLTPRRRETPRKTRSVCSPARSNASARLSTIIQEHREQAMGSFVLSPLTRKSILSDNTDIQEPGRKSWWRDLGETSRDVMEVLKNNDVQANNIFDNIEVMSQEEKHHTLDIPDSSDSESIQSIVIPQRKLFHEKENQPQKRFNPFGTRETLDIIHKTNNTTIVDKTVNVATKELFHAETKSRPIFPAALLDMSANTTASNKTITAAVEPKPRAHNLFSKQKIENKSQLAKRKNMFAKFIASDSEDDEELPEIQPKFFALQNKPNLRRSSVTHGVENSMTSSIDIELDDWQLLPSSTMLDNQLNTTQTTEHKSKKIRLSKLSEAEVDTNSSIISKTQSNKSVSSKNKSKIHEKSLQGNTSIVTRNTSKISKVDEEDNKGLNKPNSSSNTSQSLVITRSKNKSDMANKSQNASVNKSLNTNKSKNTSKLSMKQTDVDINSVNKSKSKNSTPEQQLQNNDMDIDNLDAEIELQPADDDEELNFTLEYEDDKVDDAVTSKQNKSTAEQLMTNDNSPKNTSQKNVDIMETSIKNASTASKIIDKEQNKVTEKSVSANSCEDNKSPVSKPDTFEVVVNKVSNDEMSNKENLMGNVQNNSPKSHFDTKQTDNIDKNDDSKEENQVLTVQEQSNTVKFNQENGSIRNQILKVLDEKENVQDQMSEIPFNESQKDRQESTENENVDQKQKNYDENQENTQNKQDQSIKIQNVSQTKQNQSNIIQDSSKIRQNDNQEVQKQESDEEKDETCEKEQDVSVSKNVSEELDEENEEERDEENKEEIDEENQEEKDEESQEEQDESLEVQSKSQEIEDESQEVQDESTEVQESQEVQDEDQDVQDEGKEVQDEDQDIQDESQEVQDESSGIQNESQEARDQIHEELNDSQVEQDETQEKQDDSLKEQDEIKEAQDEVQEEEDEVLEKQDESQRKQNKSQINNDLVEETDNETENNEIQEEENISREEVEQDISNQEMECEVSDKSEDDGDLEENLDNDSEQDENRDDDSDQEENRDNDSDLEEQDNVSDELDNPDNDSDQVEVENESDNENETEGENESVKASEESENNQGTDNDDDQIENTETPNVSHDTTGRYRKKSITPEAILHNSRNVDDLTTVHGRNTSVRKTKSLIQHLNRRQSLEPARESMEFSDGNRNSSAEGSGWDSHRTTRKTLRQTFGKDFTPRKSLRAMVMEKSAKRRNTTVNDVTRPQANSTEFPVPDHSVDDYEMDVTPAEPEVSIRTRQATIEECLVRAKRDWDQEKAKMEEAVKRRLEHDRQRSDDVFKVPAKPTFRRPIAKPKTKTLKPLQTLMGLENLPEELIEDMNYKPPKRFAPRNAAWLTKRLYKYLETKLEPKYDYKARVRAEKFAQVLYEFVQAVRRRGAPAVAPSHSVDALKREMARLNIVKTHFEFYNFFHDFMPREVRIKVIPDIVNKIPHPKNGVFSDIL